MYNITPLVLHSSTHTHMTNHSVLSRYTEIFEKNDLSILQESKKKKKRKRKRLID